MKATLRNGNPGTLLAVCLRHQQVEPSEPLKLKPWEMNMRTILTFCLSILLIFGILAGQAQATSIEFVGVGGGDVFHPSAYSALYGSNLPIGSVFATPPGNSSLLPIIGGLLNYATGYVFGAMTFPGGSFVLALEGGGSFTLTGGVSAASIPNGSTLLSGIFNTTGLYYDSNSGVATVSSTYSTTFLNSGLVSYFGSNLLPGGGGTFTQTLANVVNQYGGAPDPGYSFSATQSGSSILVTNPEPSSVLLLGSGLIGLGLWGRKRMAT